MFILIKDCNKVVLKKLCVRVVLTQPSQKKKNYSNTGEKENLKNVIILVLNAGKDCHKRDTDNIPWTNETWIISPVRLRVTTYRYTNCTKLVYNQVM